jgi:hypothetical protein
LKTKHAIIIGVISALVQTGIVYAAEEKENITCTSYGSTTLGYGKQSYTTATDIASGEAVSLINQSGKKVAMECRCNTASRSCHWRITNRDFFKHRDSRKSSKEDGNWNSKKTHYLHWYLASVGYKVKVELTKNK